MTTIKKFLDNKCVAWLKKTLIRSFTEPFYTIADLLMVVLVYETQSWWSAAFAIFWVWVVSPILIVAKENLGKLEQKEQDEHSQL